MDDKKINFISKRMIKRREMLTLEVQRRNYSEQYLLLRSYVERIYL